jgi:hypothetical protein
MNKLISIVLILALLQSCNQGTKNDASTDQPVAPQEKPLPEKQSFFPVTSYFKGQIYDILHKGINPLKYRTINDHTDSAWLKIESLNKEVDEFLHPEIDSVNLINLFTEKKFMDQSIDALTFTYDPIGELPDSITLRHWDVYVDPKSGNIRRVYMVKQLPENKIMQLTWQGDKWCKKVIIVNNPDGSSVVEKEEKISWDF